MKQSIRFIHCADLHLDSPYRGLKHLPNHIFQDIKESTFIALDRLVQFAIDERVDFVLFAGDIFDQQSATLKSYIQFHRALEKLNEFNIQAYISFGNHDYGIQSKTNLTFPSNTHLFKSDDVTHFRFEKGEQKVYIYSFSYDKQAVTERKIDQYVRESNDGLHIGMLHGSLQSDTDHYQYAPFLIDDLKNKRFDYWALGHIHKRMILSEEPYAVYPGNIQGRHMKETGEKGCYLVELSEVGAHLDFQPLQYILFKKDELYLQGKTLNDVIYEFEQYKEQLKKTQSKIMLRLHVSLDEDNDMLFEENKRDELIQLLNDDEEDESNWVWIENMTVERQITYDRERLKQSSHFTGEMIRTIDQKDDVTVYFNELLNHRLFRKYIDDPGEEELDEIKSEAEKLVVKKLLQGGLE